MKHQFLAMMMAFYLTLGSWKGYLALFQKGAEEPWQIFPTLVERLPQADQEALQNGIIIRNQRDLEQIIEDYTS